MAIDSEVGDEEIQIAGGRAYHVTAAPRYHLGFNRVLLAIAASVGSQSSRRAIITVLDTKSNYIRRQSFGTCWALDVVCRTYVFQLDLPGVRL